MAKKIFVTATNTSVGKTYTTLLLMKEASKLGLKPAAFKPMETGVTNGIPSDGTLLFEATRNLNTSASCLEVEDVVPVTYGLPAAPYVAKGDKHVDISFIGKSMRRVEEVCDILFIEGAGGVMVPVEEGLFMIDFPKIFDAHTLLVSPSKLGSINDTLLSMEALKNRGLHFSLAINLFEEAESFEIVTRPYYLETGIEHFLLPTESQELLKSLLKTV